MGGYVKEVVSTNCAAAERGEGGEGRGPGEQYGICLFGTAAGVPRCEVFKDSDGGGVSVRPITGRVAHIVAITLGFAQSWSDVS